MRSSKFTAIPFSGRLAKALDPKFVQQIPDAYTSILQATSSPIRFYASPEPSLFWEAMSFRRIFDSFSRHSNGVSERLLTPRV